MTQINAVILVVLTAMAGAGCMSDSTRQAPVTAEENSIQFLMNEVPAWSRENGCFSCHNNGDAARALYAASRSGHRIPARALSDTTAWLRQPSRWEHNQGDPGFSDQRLAHIQFAVALLAALESGHTKERASLEEAARKVAADQDADGAWHIEWQNPIGSPATYGAALATFMAWRTLAEARASGTSEAMGRAERWMLSLRPVNIPTAAVLLLFLAKHPEGSRLRARSESLDFLRAAQTADGGWGPYRDSPPEVFDTALVLLALAEGPDKPGVAGMIQRGRAFLLSLQSSDGSWPATTRPSGGASYAQRISTTGWALLALLRTRE